MTTTTLIVPTGWTTAQASAIDDIVDGNKPSHPSVGSWSGAASATPPQHLSIRQRERAEAAVDDGQHVSIRQVEGADQVRRDQLAQLEAGEARRFANRTDAAVHDSVAQADRVRVEPVDFAGLTSDELARLE